MATEIEITKLGDGWVEGLMYSPDDEMHHHVRVLMQDVLALPNFPGQDNGHVFRPGVGIARRIGDPWLKVGDFVMVAV
jgi:hypothetical protein